MALVLTLSACGTDAAPEEAETQAAAATVNATAETAQATDAATNVETGQATANPNPEAAVAPTDATAEGTPAPTGLTSVPAGIAPGTAASASVPGQERPDDVAAAEYGVNVYVVGLSGEEVPGREFGCGDTLTERPVALQEYPGQVGEPSRVQTALEVLFEREQVDAENPELMNSVHASSLEFEDATITGDSVTVELSGQVISAGTCDSPRIIEQLKGTAALNAGVDSAEVLVEGTPVEDWLDESAQ